MFGCLCWFWIFFFKQKTAYEMRISDWSSDVCSSDLQRSFLLSFPLMFQGMSHPIGSPAAPVQIPQLDSQPLGAWLVFGSAMVWSLGGILARLADVENAWTAVFWRSGTAALFLLGFMLLRDGRAGTVALFARMGLPGLAVALCFAIASTSFVVALQFTTVANILLMQAGVPLDRKSTRLNSSH